jgi:hypothetical protein
LKLGGEGEVPNEKPEIGVSCEDTSHGGVKITRRANALCQMELVWLLAEQQG